jgi:hypothetical protein
MPAGLLVTTPAPEPCLETVKGKVWGAGAVTLTPVEQLTRSIPLVTCTVGW